MEKNETPYHTWGPQPDLQLLNKLQEEHNARQRLDRDRLTQEAAQMIAKAAHEHVVSTVVADAEAKSKAAAAEAKLLAEAAAAKAKKEAAEAEAAAKAAAEAKALAEAAEKAALDAAAEKAADEPVVSRKKSK